MADTQEPRRPTLVQNVLDWSFLIPDTDLLLKKQIHRKSISFKSLAYIENVIFLRKYHLYIHLCIKLFPNQLQNIKNQFYIFENHRKVVLQ